MKYGKNLTGLGEKYDALLAQFEEALGQTEYKPLADKLRHWTKEGENVKPFCRLLIELYPNRPALIWEMERFLSKEEKQERQNRLEAVKRIKEFYKPVTTRPKCKSQDTARILYGFPDFNEKLEKDLAEGRVVLGGCEYEPWFPKRACNKCEEGF